MSRNGKNNKGGRPKGSKSNHTIQAERAKERIVERVKADVDGLFNAQKSLATGSQVLMCQQKKGRTFVVKNEQTVIDFLDGKIENDDERYYFITLIKPENSAIDSLFDRAFGRATQAIDHTSGGEKLNLSLDGLSNEQLEQILARRSNEGAGKA